MVTQAGPQKSGQVSPTWLTSAWKQSLPGVNIPYDNGQLYPRFATLPQAGYLQTVELDTSLNITVGTAAPSSDDLFAAVGGPYQRIRLYVNSQADLYNLTGWLSGLVSAIEKQYNYPKDTLPGEDGLWTAHGSITAGTGFIDNWVHRISLGLKLANLPYPIGLYQTALQNLDTILELTFTPVFAFPAGGTQTPPGAGLYGPAGTSVVSAQAGSGDAQIKFFNPIPVTSAQPPLKYINRWSYKTGVLTNQQGDNDIFILGKNKILRLVLSVVDGTTTPTFSLPNLLNQASPLVTKFQLMYGVETARYNETTIHAVSRMLEYYGNDLGTYLAQHGVLVFDWLVETHDPRDWFDANRVTNLRARVTLNGNTAHTYTYYLGIQEILTLEQAGFSVQPSGA